MKIKIKTLTIAAACGALLLSATEVARAEVDTNATTVAYWILQNTISDPNSPQGLSIQDLATNVGQGDLVGDLPNLWVGGSIGNSGPTFSSAVPPSSLLNANNYFSGGSASWDVGADEYSGPGGEVDCDNTAYGDIFNSPNFTEEVIFKTDYTNDPTLGTVKQTLVWNHQNSAYCHLQLNESASGNTNDIGSLLFWGWNVQNFVTCRVTAAQNGGHRLDDGHWHYAVARYNNATLTMDLLVVNDDGTSAESSTYIGESLNPGGSGSQGPLIIGNDEGYATTFDGQINQVRFSSACLPDNKLLANVTGCNTPVFNNSQSTNYASVGDVLTLSPALWPVQMEGGPLNYQWQLNGVNIPGQTNLVINLFPVSAADAGEFQLIAKTPCGASVASAPFVVNVSPKVPTPIALWRFQSTEGQTFGQAAVDDSLPNNYVDLITFNNAPNISGIGSNGEIALTNDVPPTSMFINGNNGGTNSYDASYIAGVDGVVFYPNNSQGVIFDFQTQFSLEFFFQSYGNQSANGPMELVSQGSDGGNTFRYGVNINQAANGALSFKVNNLATPPAGPSFEDTNAGIQSVVLSDRNYADGTWHYVLAKYDSTANTISVSVANQDGTGTNATVALPAGYSPLGAGDEGNFFVGRYRYPWTDGSQTDPRDFIGAIAEVQVTSGLVTPGTGQLGYIPGPPNISSISLSGNTVTIQFAGSPTAAPSSYTLIGSPTVKGTYSALSATITSLGGGNFQATVAKSGSTEFYRIQH